MKLKEANVLITGAAGFIGSFICRRLLEEGSSVIGVDNINDYYDINLKKDRLKEINKVAKHNEAKWEFRRFSIEDNDLLIKCFKETEPNIVINLAAQAGVRYSINNPSLFIESNLVGFGNILECSRKFNIDHLIYASSSSVYGGNKKLPFKETQEVNHPVSIYAATKRANELMAHAYSHLFGIPTTGLRFFTVYGPWGRPDMAPFLFTRAILEGKEMKVNNFGNMRRDFTYIDDIVECIYRCCKKPATPDDKFNELKPDPASSNAPHRLFNVGNSIDIELKYFIELIEKNLNRKAIIKYMPLPLGDVISTSSDNSRLKDWINFAPITTIEEGINKFLEWYKVYYGQ